MTITEQKRQIVIMQGQFLDSDLTEEEKELNETLNKIETFEFRTQAV